MMLDEKIVDKLKSTIFGGNENLFTKIAKTFIEHSGILVSNIQEGAKEQDQEKVFHASHSLKSSSATIGALNLSELSEQIESLSHKDPIDWDKISELATRVAEDFETVTALLKKELEQN